MNTLKGEYSFEHTLYIPIQKLQNNSTQRTSVFMNNLALKYSA